MSDVPDEREMRQLLGWGPATASVAGDAAMAQDLVWADGDLVLTAGLDTLRQDIAAALVTSLGSDPLNPTFGFDGFNAIATEPDRFLLRERLRVAIVGLLRRDPRIDRVDQVLIGTAEIEAARAGQSRMVPVTEFGIVDIEAGFRLRGRPERLQIKIGSILGSG